MVRFHVGEKVVHSPDGVCRIEEICQLEENETNRYYYKMQPVNDEHKMIYIPVEKADLKVRPLKTKAEIEKLLETEPEANLLKNVNTQKRMIVQNQAIRDDNSDLLMRLIKMYRKKQQSKQISVGDARWLRKAEEYLFSEITEVLM